jgi:hypothetical protein
MKFASYSAHYISYKMYDGSSLESITTSFFMTPGDEDQPNHIPMPVEHASQAAEKAGSDQV